MDDFLDYLMDERPFLAYFALVSLAVAACFALIFVIALAAHGFWLPLVLVALTPFVRVAFLYARFRNDNQR